MGSMTVEFEMKDGRKLRCEYGYHVTPGFTCGLPENCYPDEVDIGDPEYFIEDDPVNYRDMPKGLSAIADAMYESSEDPRFTYTIDDTPDEGPDDWGYDYD